MSLSPYIVERLSNLERQWRRSLTTLPKEELAAQRESVRAAFKVLRDVSPAALVLGFLDGGIERRREAGK